MPHTIIPDLRHLPSWHVVVMALVVIKIHATDLDNSTCKGSNPLHF